MLRSYLFGRSLRRAWFRTLRRRHVLFRLIRSVLERECRTGFPFYLHLYYWKLFREPFSPLRLIVPLATYSRRNCQVNKRKKPRYYLSFTCEWCPAAESDYELVLTMDPLYRLTSGATLEIINAYLSSFKGKT